MPQYFAPGVYVEEVPSAVQAIAGAGTSTAGFIGIVPNSITVPENSALVTNEFVGTGDGADLTFDLQKFPVNTATGTFQFRVDEVPVAATLSNNVAASKSEVTLAAAPGIGTKITGDYVGEFLVAAFSPVAAGDVKLCTTFGEFKKFFGDFSTDAGHRKLAHAVFGFFNNGGSRCYVSRAIADTGIAAILEKYEAIDEIAIVATPGITDDGIRATIVTHCKVKTEDRFAIFDSDETVETAGALDLTKLDPKNAANILPDNSDYAGYYFPWIQVFDKATKLQNPKGDGLIYVPPSGHVAGVYARVDTTRGVHKAPANEVVLGALGLKYQISKNQQIGLNPQGVNVIRDLNGNIRIWGARTVGGDANGEFRYVSVRRLMLFLRESIDEGTQFAVFEPNSPPLWAKITRNVSAFLTNVWKDGALFGNSPQEAFYVKCDAELNPPESRELGRVITEIGVAIVKPAEFVIFRISQIAGPASA